MKTAILAVIAAVLVGILVMPLSTISIHVELPTTGEAVAAQAMGALLLVLLIVTIILIVWVVRRCIRHVADAKKPNLADVF